MCKLNLTAVVVWLKRLHQTEGGEADGGWTVLVRSSTALRISATTQQIDLDVGSRSKHRALLLGHVDRRRGAHEQVHEFRLLGLPGLGQDMLQVGFGCRLTDPQHVGGLLDAERRKSTRSSPPVRP
jgi:hypothetical protein